MKINNQLLTEHFKLREFFPNALYLHQINNNGGISVDPIYNNLMWLAQRMEHIRTMIGKPLTITSGFRTPEQNRIAGGVLTSYHLSGLACDFFANGKTAKMCWDILLEYKKELQMLHVYEVIYYPTKGIIHVSCHSKSDTSCVLKMFISK